MATKTVTTNPIFRGILAGIGLRLIVHCGLDVRTSEHVIAWLCGINKQDAALITPDVPRALQVLDGFGWKHKAKPLGTMRLLTFANGPRIWMLERAEDLPDNVETFCVLSAHEVPRLQRLPKTGIIAGELPQRGHWFQELQARHEGAVLRIRLADAEKAYSHLVGKADPQHPDFRRRMLLEDAPPRRSKFGGFAKARLRIATMKGGTFLSKSQQEEADRQLGKGWEKRSDGRPVVTFEASPLQRRIRAHLRVAESRGFKDIIVIKPRRAGATSLFQALAYQSAVELPSYPVIQLAHTLGATQRMFRAASLFHQHDPYRPKLTTDSQTQLAFSNGSSWGIGTASGQGVSRGDGVRLFILSEFAHYCAGPNQARDVDSLMAGILAAAQGGRIIRETTPEGRNHAAQVYFDAKTGKSGTFPIFLRWFDDPGNRCAEGDYSPEEIAQSLTDEELDLVKRHGLTPAQIAWRRVNKRAFKHLFLQEYPEDDQTCFITKGLRYFDSQQIIGLRAVLMLRPKAIIVPIPGGEIVRIEKPQPGVQYCGGSDTSEGLPGRDPNGIGIIRRDTGKMVAWAHGLFSIEQQGDLAVQLGSEYNYALLGVERDNHGHAVLKRIVSRGVDLYAKPHYAGGRLFAFNGKPGDRKSWRLGWTTNEQTRAEMLDLLGSIVTDATADHITDLGFLEECLTFGLQSTGRYEHDAGCHDDRVMKWAIAYMMRKYTQGSGLRLEEVSYS